jgi:hypothetical protein
MGVSSPLGSTLDRTEFAVTPPMCGPDQRASVGAGGGPRAGHMFFGKRGAHDGRPRIELGPSTKHEAQPM